MSNLTEEERVRDMNGQGSQERWPSLPLSEWDDTRRTLQRFCQIVGKVRLASAPWRNHWWHAPFYVTTRGLTTGPMAAPDGTFAIDFDCIDHRLVVTCSWGATESFPMAGLSVAEFYEKLFAILPDVGVKVDILARPFDISPSIPFPVDTTHASYDADAIHRWWRILSRSDMLFKRFNSDFVGKSSPVHMFWHSFDLALTRFSGRPAPEMPGADRVTREAYSHEVISFGWWAGDDRVPAPAFYSYTAPEPPDLTQQPLRPTAAYWATSGGGHLALLMYDDVRALPDPDAAVLEFLRSSYEAGARTARWPDELTR